MQGFGDPVSASGQGEKAGSQASSSNDCSSSLVGNLATGEYTITGKKLSDKTSSLQKRRQKSNKRTAELSSEELEERKKKRRLYMKNYRAKQSKEATQARLQHLRQSAAERRDTESEQGRKARLQQMCQHAVETRDSESELAKEARLQQMRQHATETRDPESELAKEARLQQMRQHAAETRDSESELAKQARLQQILETTRYAFRYGRTRSVEFRKVQIKKLMEMFKENMKEINEALIKDMSKPMFEIYAGDIVLVLNECIGVLNNINDWMKPKKLKAKAAINLLSDNMVYNQPYGVVLIIGAWNYPISSLLVPLVGAIAAGNCVILKPSETCKTVALILAKLIPHYLDKHCFHIILEGRAGLVKLLKEKFDYIYYSGSRHMGNLVHKAANEYLTPVTLQLGGRNVLYIDDTIDMEIAAQLIISAKWFNMGQTSTAPDYILCTVNVQQKLLLSLETALKNAYGNDPKSSPHLVRIINDKHFQRLESFLKDGKIAIGGETDQLQKYIAPTVLIDVNADAPVMEKEIFGPILPIINIKTEENAIEFMREREPFLTLYLYTTSKNTQKRFTSWIQSEAVVINDSVSFGLNSSLPSGGWSSCGINLYHGKHSFETFSKKIAYLRSKPSIMMNYLYKNRNPPIREKVSKMFHVILKERNWIFIQLPLTLSAVTVGFAAGYLLNSLI